jgi:glutamine amidotransferase
VSTAPRIVIADYGMGNLRSVAKALEHVGAETVISPDPATVAGAPGLILPGVGAFPEAMRAIRERDLAAAITALAGSGAPILGICLGMQLLFDRSSEHEGAGGLGLMEGGVEPLPAGGLKLPNIGWSPIRFARDSKLCEGIEDGEPFYFVHSFAAGPADADLIATSTHGEPFAAVVGRDNVFGTQFHPEKSSAAGLRMLANFRAMVAARSIVPC